MAWARTGRACRRWLLTRAVGHKWFQYTLVAAAGGVHRVPVYPRLSPDVRCLGRCVRRTEDRDTNSTRCFGPKSAGQQVPGAVDVEMGVALHTPVLGEQDRRLSFARPVENDPGPGDV